MLTFFIITVFLDALALYLIYNRIDGLVQLEFLFDFVSDRKNIFEFIIALVVVIMYLPFTIPVNVKYLFKK